MSHENKCSAWKKPNNLLMGFIVVFGLSCVAFSFWQVRHASSVMVNPGWKQMIQKDTHGALSIVKVIPHDHVTMVVLKTPRGMEIAYLIGGQSYLAIGPLMDLKTGKNVTPIWEKQYAAS